VTAYLLDVNVLVALMWPAHEAHSAALKWFRLSGGKSWATCGVTQAGFVRIVSNPAFSSDALSPQQAMELLHSNVSHAAHRLWKDDAGFLSVVTPFAARITGHRQVTDAFLLGLALRNKGKVATLDRGMLSLVPPGMAEPLLEIVG
jgi:toxin-antitoxin system PIN domain toxin